MYSTSINPVDQLNDGKDNGLGECVHDRFGDDVNTCLDAHEGLEDHGSGGLGTYGGACDIILSPISISTQI
jgi:hypothetical protein